MNILRRRHLSAQRQSIKFPEFSIFGLVGFPIKTDSAYRRKPGQLLHIDHHFNHFKSYLHGIDERCTNIRDWTTLFFLKKDSCQSRRNDNHFRAVMFHAAPGHFISPLDDGLRGCYFLPEFPAGKP